LPKSGDCREAERTNAQGIALIVEIAGDPNVRVKLDMWPDVEDFGALTTDDLHAMGMRISALPVVNAIPMTCAAEPGIRTYAGLTAVSGRVVGK
jgi:hypothetical protein